MRRPLLQPLRRVAFLSLLVACGSRTGLFDEEEGYLYGGGGVGAGGDGRARRDGGFGDEDDPDADTFEDAPPPLDVQPPVDVSRKGCPPGATLIYTITQTNELQSFDPATGQFTFISNIACQTTVPGATPFSMAVNRIGVAYILFTDEHIYQVSTLNGACVDTPYAIEQAGFKQFGMGITTVDDNGTEALFVAGSSEGNTGGTTGLGRIDDFKNFTLTKVADFNGSDVHNAEFTGTGTGGLYGFYRKTDNVLDTTSYIGQIATRDVGTVKVGDVIGEHRFDNLAQGDGWAFAFWGGDFYMFHAPNGTTLVTRYRPTDLQNPTVDVAQSSVVIVGAGVSTCAPQQ